MEDGDGLVGQVKPLHLDAGGGVLPLKLDDGRCDLALQLFLHLALFGFAHGALKRHLGLDPRVRRHPLGQQLLKAHLLQKLRAVADADGDVLSVDGKAAAVQKAVDGHTVPLHLLQQVPQGGFVHGGITEQVLDLELKAFRIGLQRSQKPGAEALIQRRCAAQGKDDLLGLPQHPGVLDDDLPKAGRKRRVRHKLRPKLGNEWCHSGTPFGWCLQHKLPRPVWGVAAEKKRVLSERRFRFYKSHP